MKTAVLICPGRGTYYAPELGTLARHFPDAALMARFDTLRAAAGQETLTALDGADRFALSRHARGDNASALIYAATIGDALSINGERVRVVAVTGNSMAGRLPWPAAGPFRPMQALPSPLPWAG